MSSVLRTELLDISEMHPGVYFQEAARYVGMSDNNPNHILRSNLANPSFGLVLDFTRLDWCKFTYATTLSNLV